jgi:DNA-binding MarR family transcriptional regulator
VFSKVPDSLWGLPSSPSQFLVLLRVMKRCGFDGEGECFESQQVMADACAMDADTVAKALRRLEEDGWIIIQRRHRKTSLITLTEKSKKHVLGEKFNPQNAGQ